MAEKALLWKTLGDQIVRCQLCSHYCRILPGKRGFCQARENRGGTLFSLVFGRPVGIAVDPIEKKPFFHFRPGTKCLSFGTVGCNFRCLGCFVPGTPIVTEKGLVPIEEIFEKGTDEEFKEGTFARKSGYSVITHAGTFSKVVRTFNHLFDGELVVVKPHYLPEFRCTPYHELFVWRNGKISKVKAGELRQDDFLLVPKNFPELFEEELDAEKLLSQRAVKTRKAKRKSLPVINRILEMRAAGMTSKQIGLATGMHPAYVRTLFSRIKRHGADFLRYDLITLVGKNGRVRFKFEKSAGIPRRIPFDEDLAALLGYYCSEGSAYPFKNRPNAHGILFSLGLHEAALAERICDLVEKIFGFKPTVRTRKTALMIVINSTSLALLFKMLCGNDAHSKKVPGQLLFAPRPVVRAFLKACNEGDGWTKGTDHPLSIDTVSKELARGLYFLFLRLGVLPSFYAWNPSTMKTLEERTVSQSLLYYVKVYAGRSRQVAGLAPAASTRNNVLFKENEQYFFVPVHKLSREAYFGPVYNLEVENDHSYLASFASVGNCQNWEISQAVAEDSGGPLVSPEHIVETGFENECDGFAYTYNEPTIFFEYWRSVVLACRAKEKEHKIPKADRKYHVMVSNGFFTKEFWDAVMKEKLLDAVRIDLKSFRKEFYNRYCSARLEPVLENIKRVHESKIPLEVITLVIPGENDSDEELSALCAWLASVSKEIPLHFSRFFPYHKALDREATSDETLLGARRIALDAGLKYVYVGNAFIPGAEDSKCPKCGSLLVARTGFESSVIGLAKKRGGAACAKCGEKIPFVL